MEVCNKRIDFTRDELRQECNRSNKHISEFENKNRQRNIVLLNFRDWMNFNSLLEVVVINLFILVKIEILRDCIVTIKWLGKRGSMAPMVITFISLI